MGLRTAEHTLGRGPWTRKVSPRLGLAGLIACALVALALPAVAGAILFISGSASGHTIPLGNGTFQVVGTYVDSDGQRGTYHGTYTEITTGYTSCRATGLSSIACGRTALFPYRCNLIRGELTFRSRGKYVTLDIGGASLGPPGSRIQSGICLQEGSSDAHDLFLLGTNRTAVWPATEEEFSRGYGILASAEGSLVGTSIPQGESVYSDELGLDLRLFEQQ